MVHAGRSSLSVQVDFHSRPSSGGADLERVGFALFVMAARKDGKAFLMPPLEIREWDTLAVTRLTLAAESKVIRIAVKEVKLLKAEFGFASGAKRSTSARVA